MLDIDSADVVALLNESGSAELVISLKVEPKLLTGSVVVTWEDRMGSTDDVTSDTVVGSAEEVTCDDLIGSTEDVNSLTVVGSALEVT